MVRGNGREKPAVDRRGGRREGLVLQERYMYIHVYRKGGE